MKVQKYSWGYIPLSNLIKKIWNGQLPHIYMYRTAMFTTIAELSLSGLQIRAVLQPQRVLRGEIIYRLSTQLTAVTWASLIEYSWWGCKLSFLRNHSALTKQVIVNMKLFCIGTLLVIVVTSVSSDCVSEEHLDWSSYGHFQTCRSHHIKQALQVWPFHKNDKNKMRFVWGSTIWKVLFW